jgi:hypothetical protein
MDTIIKPTIQKYILIMLIMSIWTLPIYIISTIPFPPYITDNNPMVLFIRYLPYEYILFIFISATAIYINEIIEYNKLEVT